MSDPRDYVFCPFTDDGVCLGDCPSNRDRACINVRPMNAARGWDPKGLREALCQQQAVAPYGRDRKLMQALIDQLDLHRPLGSDGKHNNLHTPTCGCDDE